MSIDNWPARERNPNAAAESRLLTILRSIVQMRQASIGELRDAHPEYKRSDIGNAVSALVSRKLVRKAPRLSHRHRYEATDEGREAAKVRDQSTHGGTVYERGSD